MYISARKQSVIMSSIRFLLAAAIPVTVMCLVAVAANEATSNRTPGEAGSSQAAVPARRPATEMVRVISFKLKDGRAASGKIISDDRSQVTIAEIAGGKILAVSYSRVDMEPRSISYQSVSEYQYWMSTGQYFESHTWDWQDDADEFAQALRCYESARDLATQAMGKDSAAAQDADARIGKILESRERWIETAKPRAQMAELELKSTLAQRLDNIGKSLTSLQASVDSLNQSRSSYETSLASFQRDMNIRMDRMMDDIVRCYDYVRNNVYVQPGTIIVPGPTPR